MDYNAAADRLGVPVAEIARVDESPGGVVIVTRDGQGYIDVPEDRPDGAGLSGLMYLSAPFDNYKGVFPVFSQPAGVDRDLGVEPVPADDAGAGGDGEPQVLRDLPKPDLVDKAKALGIDVKHNWSIDRLVEKITDALEAATANPGDTDTDTAAHADTDTAAHADTDADDADGAGGDGE